MTKEGSRKGIIIDPGVITAKQARNMVRGTGKPPTTSPRMHTEEVIRGLDVRPLLVPVKQTPIVDGPSEQVKRSKTRIKGVRVVYDVGGGEGVATRDHPTAQRWEVTKHGQLILRDKNRKQIARYRQFVWREVIAGNVRDTV